MSTFNGKSHFDGSEDGRDGKPCRACTDVKTWLKMTRNEKKTKQSDKATPAIEVQNSKTVEPERKDCPLDKDELGRNTWSFLHTTAAYYPEKPTPQEQKDMKKFIHIFSRFYPCDFCAADLRERFVGKMFSTPDKELFDERTWLFKTNNVVSY